MGGGRRFVCGMAKVAVNKLRAERCRRDADAGKAGRLRKSIFVMRSIVVAVTLCMDQHECNLQDKYNFWQSPLNLNYITAKRNDMINLFCHLAIIFLGLMSLPGIVFAVRNLWRVPRYYVGNKGGWEGAGKQEISESNRNGRRKWDWIERKHFPVPVPGE